MKRSAMLAVLLLSGCLLTPAPIPKGYPHLALYGSIRGDGYPLLDSTGTIDPAVVAQVARYQEVSLDVNPITPYRPDIAKALRAKRPDIRLLAYVGAQVIWYAEQPDSLRHYPTRFRHLLRDLDGFLYNMRGREFSGANVNLAKRNSAGSYVVAEALADLWRDVILKSGTWDGIFVDLFCDRILWTETLGEQIDLERAGYKDRASFAAGWLAGTDTLAARLRRDLGDKAIIVGNCGQGTKYDTFNGWMSEGFPWQNGGTWEANMFNEPGGYLLSEPRWRAPSSSYIFTAYQRWDPYSRENARSVRYGLGSASLGSGYAVFGEPSHDSRVANYMTWWYDEYAVDAQGRSSESVMDTGWLGEPVGQYAKLDSVYQRDFQHGYVLVNPTSDSQMVAFPQPVGRIVGKVDPLTNNGEWSAVQMVPPNDALFLRRRP